MQSADHVHLWDKPSPPDQARARLVRGCDATRIYGERAQM